MLIKFSITLLMLSLLFGCVTTEEKLFKTTSTTKQQVEARVQIAITYLQDGKPDMALVHLKEALDIDDESARVHEITALSLEETGELDLAEKHFEEMLDAEPDYTRGRSNYASFLIRQEKYDDAYDEFKIVVADIYFKGRAIAFQQLGRCADKLGKDAEVEPAYQRAVALDNSLNSAKLELAEIKFNNQDYVKAQHYLASYRKQVKPSSARALLLGVKLARVFEDKSDEASFALALKNLYPRSKEYLDYIKNIRDSKS